MNSFLMIDKNNDDAFLVEYFESGCLCLAKGKIEVPKTGNKSEKADYYMSNCKCSRHPEAGYIAMKHSSTNLVQY